MDFLSYSPSHGSAAIVPGLTIFRKVTPSPPSGGKKLVNIKNKQTNKNKQTKQTDPKKPPPEN